MPNCKNCGTRLTKFDKDICPVCGEKNPLEGVSSDTVEITSNLDLSEAELKDFNRISKFKAELLFIFLGWSGAAIFYLNYLYQALVWAAINIVLIIGGLGSLLAFITPLGPIWGYLIALGCSYIVNIATAIIIYFKSNLKDGFGEFLR